jgi:predicted component of type VI protein secretion system
MANARTNEPKLAKTLRDLGAMLEAGSKMNAAKAMQTAIIKGEYEASDDNVKAAAGWYAEGAKLSTAALRNLISAFKTFAFAPVLANAEKITSEVNKAVDGLGDKLRKHASKDRWECHLKIHREIEKDNKFKLNRDSILEAIKPDSKGTPADKVAGAKASFAAAIKAMDGEAMTPAQTKAIAALKKAFAI